MTVSTINSSATETNTLAAIKAKSLAWRQAFYAIQEVRGQADGCKTKSDWTANKLVTYSIYRNFSEEKIQAVASHLTDNSSTKLALEGKKNLLSNAWYEYRVAKAAGKTKVCSAIIKKRVQPLQREIAKLQTQYIAELEAQAA